MSPQKKSLPISILHHQGRLCASSPGQCKRRKCGLLFVGELADGKMCKCYVNLHFLIIFSSFILIFILFSFICCIKIAQALARIGWDLANESPAAAESPQPLAKPHGLIIITENYYEIQKKSLTDFFPLLPPRKHTAPDASNSSSIFELSPRAVELKVFLFSFLELRQIVGVNREEKIMHVCAFSKRILILYLAFLQKILTDFVENEVIPREKVRN